MLVTKEGQHVTWHRVLRPDAGDADRGADRGRRRRRHLRQRRVHARRASVSRGAAAGRAGRRSSTLQITLTADRPVAKPQEPGVFSVQVTDAGGAPVQAQVSLGVIDEAVYAIKPDDTPDPVRFFYRREYSRVGHGVLARLLLHRLLGHRAAAARARRRRRPFTLADFKGDKQVQPQVRKEFPDAIYWLGDLVTDAAGPGQGRRSSIPTR